MQCLEFELLNLVVAVGSSGSIMKMRCIIHWTNSVQSGFCTLIKGSERGRLWYDDKKKACNRERLASLVHATQQTVD